MAGICANLTFVFFLSYIAHITAQSSHNGIDRECRRFCRMNRLWRALVRNTERPLFKSRMFFTCRIDPSSFDHSIRALASSVSYTVDTRPGSTIDPAADKSSSTRQLSPLLFLRSTKLSPTEDRGDPSRLPSSATPSSARPASTVPARSRFGEEGGVGITKRAWGGETDRERFCGLPAPEPVLLPSRRRRLLGDE